MIHHLASRIWMFLLLLKISDVILYFGLPKCLFKSNVNKSWQCQILSLWFLETSEVFIVYWRKLDTFFWTIKQILGKTLNNLWTITKALLSINLPRFLFLSWFSYFLVWYHPREMWNRFIIRLSYSIGWQLESLNFSFNTNRI